MHAVPTNRDGKIREQVEVEKKVKREYPEKWGSLTEKHLYNFYRPDYLNSTVQQSITYKCPYNYDNSGDSFFVSRDMYDTLIHRCRCGRVNSEGHMLKCLQKAKYEHDETDENDVMKDLRSQLRPELPKTSSAMIGWPRANYMHWDRSTNAKTVVEKIIGHRVTDHPYNNVFIG